MTILIKNGQVINPATNMNQVADVYIDGDKVVEIREKIERQAERVIDATGCYVMPGFIDLHVHFRDPGLVHKEDLYSDRRSGPPAGGASDSQVS